MQGVVRVRFVLEGAAVHWQKYKKLFEGAHDTPIGNGMQQIFNALDARVFCSAILANGFA